MSALKLLLTLSLVCFTVASKPPTVPKKILAIPVAWPSHVDDFQKLCAELVKRGHAVTLVLNIPHVAVGKDCAVAARRLEGTDGIVQCVHYNESRRDISVSHGQYTILGAEPTVDMVPGEMVAEVEKLSQASPVTTLRVMVGYAMDRLGLLMRDKDFLEHVATTEYDIYLSDFFDFGAGILSDHMNLPRVELQTGGTIPWLFYLFHNMLYSPAYVPSVGMTDLAGKYDLLKRVDNFVRLCGMTVLRSTIVIPMINSARRAHNVSHRSSRISGFQSEAMLIIALGEAAWNPSYPVPPNVKTVGQLVEEKALTPLTPEIEALFSNDAEPVVVISEGSLLTWADEELSTLIAGLYTLQPPVRVLCKLLSPRRQRMQEAGVNWAEYEASGRFMFLPWIPQAAALAHPNTQLLVSHCGMHGIREALEHAIPIVCIPIVGNQFENTELVIFHGVGFHLEKTLLKAGDVNATMRVIKDGLECASCKKRASVISRRMSWHVIPPVEEAANWLEYVAMTSDGEAFLVPRGYDLPWYVTLCLDVMALLAAVLFALVFLVWSCIRRVVWGRSSGGKGKAKKD